MLMLSSSVADVEFLEEEERIPEQNASENFNTIKQQHSTGVHKRPSHDSPASRRLQEDIKKQKRPTGGEPQLTGRRHQPSTPDNELGSSAAKISPNDTHVSIFFYFFP